MSATIIKAKFLGSFAHGEETRIFRIKNSIDNIPHYGDLLERLNSLFPQLKKNFSICWYDEEGDLITLSSDEELRDAVMHKNKAAILKLFLKHSLPSSSTTLMFDVAPFFNCKFASSFEDKSSFHSAGQSKVESENIDALKNKIREFSNCSDFVHLAKSFLGADEIAIKNLKECIDNVINSKFFEDSMSKMFHSDSGDVDSKSKSESMDSPDKGHIGSNVTQNSQYFTNSDESMKENVNNFLQSQDFVNTVGQIFGSNFDDASDLKAAVSNLINGKCFGDLAHSTAKPKCEEEEEEGNNNSQTPSYNGQVNNCVPSTSNADKTHRDYKDTIRFLEEIGFTNNNDWIGSYLRQSNGNVEALLQMTKSK